VSPEDVAALQTLARQHYDAGEYDKAGDLFLAVEKAQAPDMADLGRTALSGPTMSWGDELTALGKTVSSNYAENWNPNASGLPTVEGYTPTGDWRQDLQEQKTGNLQFGINPLEGLAGEAAIQHENLAMSREKMGPGKTLLAEAGASLPLGLRATQKVASSTLAKNVGKGLVGGGVIGAISGAGEGRTGPERMGNALFSSGFGAAAGAFWPFMGTAINKWQLGPEGRAREKVRQDLRRAGITAGEATQAVAAAPDRMLTDVDPVFERRALAVQTIPGKGQQAIGEAIGNRALKSKKRVSDLISGKLGSKIAAESVEELEDTARKQSAPLYRRLHDMPDISESDLGNLMQRPSFKRSYKQAATDVRDDFPDMPEIGVAGKVSQTNFSTLNQTKIHLDHQILAERMSKDMDADKIRRLSNVRSDLLGVMDSKFPGYAEARAVYAGPAQMADSVLAGEKVWHPRVRIRQLQKDVAGMSPLELDSFRVGAASELLDKVENQRIRNYGAMIGDNKDKLRIVFDNDTVEQIVEVADLYDQMLKSGNRIVGGSWTANRQEAVKDLAGEVGVEVSDLHPGNMVSVITKRVLNGILGRARAQMMESTAEKLIPYLTQTDPKKMAALLSDLGQRDPEFAAKIGALLSAPSASVVGQEISRDR